MPDPIPSKEELVEVGARAAHENNERLYAQSRWSPVDLVDWSAVTPNVKAAYLKEATAILDAVLPCVLKGAVEALGELEAAEREYRRAHDTFGDGHAMTGRQWDVLRHKGDRARTTRDGLLKLMGTTPPPHQGSS